MRTRVWIIQLLFVVALVSAATSSNNYNVYQYDMTVPQFTPDGRLLQVEYAASAADHSTPVLLAPISEDLVLLCTTRRRVRRADQPDHPQPHLAVDSIVQERLVLVQTGTMTPTTTTTTTTIHHKYQEDVVVVALAGVLADSLALLETVEEERFSRQLMYGGASLSPQVVARTIADQCQRHAFGGGLRPFGATMLVCGTQPCFIQGDGSSSKSISIYQMNPSGAMTERPYETLFSAGCSKGVVGCVVMGGGSVARTLERRVLSLYENDEDMPISQRIGSILSLLSREPSLSLGSIDESVQLCLEAVLVSTKKGAIKLSEKQIEAFLRKAT